MRASRRSTLALLALSILILTAHPARADDPIPLKIVRGVWIVIPVRINGAGPFDFLLDSGTNTTIIHTGFARALGLAAADRIELVTLAGSEIVPRSFLAEVTVGAASAASVEALWSEMREIRALDPSIEGIKGVLGTSFLARFNYLVDYRAERIEFEAASEIEQRLGGKRVPMRPMQEEAGRAVIRARIGGEPFDLILDPGTAAVVLFARAQRRLASNLKRSGEPMLAATDVGRVRVETAVLSACEIGGKTWRQLPVLLAPESIERAVDGLLPMNLFPSIYINHRQGYVVVGEEAMRDER